MSLPFFLFFFISYNCHIDIKVIIILIQLHACHLKWTRHKTYNKVYYLSITFLLDNKVEKQVEVGGGAGSNSKSSAWNGIPPTGLL